jgi:hypothetical protein
MVATMGSSDSPQPIYATPNAGRRDSDTGIDPLAPVTPPAAPAAPLPTAPKFEPPPENPLLEFLKRQTENAQFATIQDRVSAESARLMATYGARLAMSGRNASPLG